MYNIVKLLLVLIVLPNSYLCNDRNGLSVRQPPGTGNVTSRPRHQTFNFLLNFKYFTFK